MDYDYELGIIGAGAAGMTAGIYAGRGGISSIIFEGKTPGGLAMIAPVIENFPGDIEVSGSALMDRFRKHCLKWTTIKELEPVCDLEVKEDGIRVVTDEGEYWVGALLVATGAEHKRLGIPGESEFFGKGISQCATCDGFFFKDKKVAMVGGGNSAALEALYLEGLGIEVHLIHRRNQLRAEKAYQEQIFNSRIKVHWDTIMTEIRGDNTVESAILKNVKTGEETEEAFDGVFISIGISPNVELAKKIGCECTDEGYIKVDGRQRTTVNRVYAAGDVTGGIRQIVTAAAEGACAALQCAEVLGKGYPF
jgi:thioredoxin reductase (NADPH)